MAVERVFIHTIGRNTIILYFSGLDADWLSGGFTIDANISEPGDTVYGNYQDPVTPHLDNTGLVHKTACPLFNVIATCREQ